MKLKLVNDQPCKSGRFGTSPGLATCRTHCGESSSRERGRRQEDEHSKVSRLFCTIHSPLDEVIFADMFQFRLPQLPSFGNLFQSGINIPKAEVHDVEERPEKRARTLKHLLKANHINHSIIYNHLRFHNHTPHILGSAYILGAEADELTYIYEEESRNLEPWRDSPGEIAKHDWRDFLGKRE